MIHELSERIVTSFLETNLVCKGVADKIVNLRFEIEQLLSELIWVLHVCFVIDNSSTALEDVRIHSLNDETECIGVTSEHVEHEL